jgi:acetyltransferase (GNAT) family protein
MRHLPDRPNLDQLRHQARELQRAAAAGDPDATRRLQVVSLKTTLSAAQLALAREYGFSSWTRLKAEVERRRASDPARYVIRPVNSLEELTRVFDFVGAHVTPRITQADRRFRELVHRFPEDRSLMLVVEDRHRLVGGLLACRRGYTAAVRAIGLAPGLPVEGLMTRLLQTVETEAMRLGASQVYEGGVGDLRDLYERQGYFGRNPMTKRLLPLPGRAREALPRKLS